MINNILHISSLGSWSDRTRGVEDRKFGITIGKLYSMLQKLQTYSFSKVVGVPHQRFLSSVQEVPCTQNVTPLSATAEDVTLQQSAPLLVNVRSCSATRKNEDVFLHVVYNDDTQRIVAAERAHSDGVPHGSLDITKLKQGYVDTDVHKRLYFRVDDADYHVGNAKPLHEDTIFKIRDRNETEKCYLNKLPGGRRSRECPCSVPFMPSVHSSVSLVALLKEGFTYDVWRQDGGGFAVQCEYDTADSLLGRSLVLRELKNYAPPEKHDYRQPRIVRIPMQPELGEAIAFNEIVRFRGPYIRKFGLFKQGIRKCDTSVWKTRLRQRRRYLERGTEITDAVFTHDFVADAEVEPLRVFEDMDRVYLADPPGRGIVFLEHQDSKFKAAQGSDIDHPFYVRIQRKGEYEYYCNLKLDEEDEVCRYVRRHELPYILSSMSLQDSTQLSSQLQHMLPSVTITDRVVDGAESSEQANQRDDNDAMAYGLRHERDALLTLQHHLDAVDFGKYEVVSNTARSFQTNGGVRTTPDGFVLESNTIVAVVEAKTHVSAKSVMKTPSDPAIAQLTLHMQATSVKKGILISWSMQHSMVFELDELVLKQSSPVRSVVYKRDELQKPLHTCLPRTIPFRMTDSILELTYEDAVYTMRPIPCVPEHSGARRHDVSIRTLDDCADETCFVEWHDGTRTRNAAAALFTTRGTTFSQGLVVQPYTATANATNLVVEKPAQPTLTWLRLHVDGRCVDVFAQDSKQSIQSHMSLLPSVRRSEHWKNWWTELMTLVALDSDARRGVMIVIDPEVKNADCESGAIHACLLYTSDAADE